MNGKVHANRKYKDSVFRMLFHDKKELLKLYNALNGTDYQDPEQLMVTTLENAIYMPIKNDVSFLLDARLMLYEHQSTWNPNIPLRDLFYISRLLEKTVLERSLYSSRQVKIPAPHFVVFYNGAEDVPEDTVLKLSDAFAASPGQMDGEEPELELKVRFLNINKGYNQELMERCRTLREYSEFVARIRSYAGGSAAIEEAVERAVTECIEEGILADFLRSQRAEVIAMSIFEYNEEEELKKLRQAEFQIGKEEGIQEGIKKGRTEGKAEAVVLLLGLKGTVPEKLKAQILMQTDASLLESWLRAAAQSGTIEVFMEETGLKR